MKRVLASTGQERDFTEMGMQAEEAIPEALQKGLKEVLFRSNMSR